MKLSLFLRAGALGLGSLAAVTPASAEVTRTTPLGFVSRNEVVVSATPKEVWLALITPANWWDKAHTWSGDAKNLSLTPQAGGCFCEIIPEVDEPGRFTLEGSVEHMRVVQAYPEAALRMVGSLGPLQSEPVTGVLTIVLSSHEKGTRIVWEYNVGGAMRYEVPVIAKAVDGVMATQLAALAKPLGVVAVPPPPPPPAPAPEPAEAPSGGTAAPAGAPSAPLAAKPAASAPAAKPAASVAAPKPAAAPAAAKPAGSAPAAAPKPAPKPAASAPKPAPKTTPKPTSVDDAFSDLDDKPRA